MKTYNFIYNFLFRARNVTRVVAKIAAWFTGIPAVGIAVWANSLGKPMIAGNPFAINFAVSLAALFLLPPLFNFAMRRVAAAARAKTAARPN